MLDEIRHHIAAHREVFHELETILVESGYDVISRSIVEDRVDVRTGRGLDAVDESLDGKKAWNDLLKRAKAFSIEKRGGGYWYLAGTAASGKYSATVEYVHAPLANSKYKACSPGYRKVACGECVVQVDEAWWIYYWWYPPDLSEGAYDQCAREGHVALGD